MPGNSDNAVFRGRCGRCFGSGQGFSRLRSAFVLLLTVLICASSEVHGQSEVLSYQGRLQQGGQPAAGDFDFRLTPFADAGSTMPLGPAAVVTEVPVREGIFAVELTLAEAALAAPDVWLEVAVRESGQPVFSTLSPRQRVSLTPQTHLALRAAPDSVAGSSVVDGSVTAGKIADTAITSTHIAPGAVSSGQIPFNTVTASKIQSGAVHSTALSSNSVASGEIQANAVLAAEIARDAVGASQIANIAVDSAAIRAGAVGASEISAGAVGSDQITAGAVGSAAIVDGSVGATQINTSQVQRRVSGSCAAGQGIRQVDSAGTVVCQTDGQGIVGFNSPVTYSVSSINGQGEQSVAMSPESTHICMLAEVDLREMDSGGNERPWCEMIVSGGNYQLIAHSSAGRDNDAYCQGLCFAKVTIP